MPVDTVLTWVGLLQNAAPTKDESIVGIESDLAQMTPAGRQLAASLIRTLLNEHKA